jgi:hypothetical protein
MNLEFFIRMTHKIIFLSFFHYIFSSQSEWYYKYRSITSRKKCFQLRLRGQKNIIDGLVEAP